MPDSPSTPSAQTPSTSRPSSLQGIYLATSNTGLDRGRTAHPGRPPHRPDGHRRRRNRSPSGRRGGAAATPWPPSCGLTGDATVLGGAATVPVIIAQTVQHQSGQSTPNTTYTGRYHRILGNSGRTATTSGIDVRVRVATTRPSTMRRTRDCLSLANDRPTKSTSFPPSLVNGLRRTQCPMQPRGRATLSQRTAGRGPRAGHRRRGAASALCVTPKPAGERRRVTTFAEKISQERRRRLPLHS